METRTIEEVRARQLIEVERISEALEGMHKVAGLTSISRERRIKAHNARTHVRECNFDDFVLRGMSDTKKSRKLMFRWRGPYRITKVLSDFLFEVEDLRSASRSVVHGTRLKFFRNSDFNVSEECTAQLKFQEEEYCVVSEFLDLRLKDGELQILVKWKGFDDEDPGWESLDVMRGDVPALVTDFVDEIKESGTPRQRKIAATL